MPTLPNMSLVTPAQGGDSGTWDDKINACFVLADAHDHTAGKGARVPTAGLNINADVPMGGFGITALGKITFNTIAAPVSGSKNLFVNSADNELYWRSNAGVNVKLTSGASINTTLVGGIVGDYSSVGAALAYDDANKRYTFKTQTATWARTASGPIRIYEFNTSESVYVEHVAAAALAASYTVTWPVPPGAQTAIQMASSGDLVLSNTFTSAVTAPDYKISGTLTQAFNPQGAVLIGATWSRQNDGSFQTGNSNTDAVLIPVNMRDGDRIQSFGVNVQKNSNAANTITAKLQRARFAGTSTLATGTNNSAGPIAVVVGTNSVNVYDSTYMYWIEVTQSSAAPSANDIISWAIVTYNRE